MYKDYTRREARMRRADRRQEWPSEVAAWVLFVVSALIIGGIAAII